MARAKYQSCGTLAGIEEGGGGMATMSCYARGADGARKRRMRSSVVTLSSAS
jgi:hypothetical protein